MIHKVSSIKDKIFITMNKITLITFLVVIIACSSIKTNYDYDKNADFSGFKSYAFNQPTMELQLNQLDKNNLFTSIKNELAARGLTESATPDVIIDVHIKGKTLQTATERTTGFGGFSSYYGFRGYGYGNAFTTTQVSYDTFTEGTLLIAMIEKNSNTIVWQGTGIKTIDENASDKKREKNISNGVKRVMANYPPKAK